MQIVEMATQGQQDIHGVAGMHANVNVWPEIADPAATGIVAKERTLAILVVSEHPVYTPRTTSARTKGASSGSSTCREPEPQAIVERLTLFRRTSRVSPSRKHRPCPVQCRA